MAFDLAAEGHNVHVVTSRQLYEAPAANLSAAEIVNGVKVHRLATSRLGRARVAGRIADYGSFYAAAAAHLLGHVKAGDLIVAKTDPPMISIVAAAVARARGAHLINWLQDLFPEVAQAAGLGGALGKPWLQLLRQFRNWSLSQATINVAISAGMRDHLIEEGISRDRLAVVANWADGSIVRPMKTSPLRREWGLEEKIVVAYSGNLGRVHDVSTLLEAIEIIRHRSADALASKLAFVFVGGGALRGSLEHAVEARSLSNVRICPYQPQERLAETLAIADIHLVSLRPEFERFVLPSKIYGVLAAARPTIFVGSSIGEIASLLRRHDCGVTTPVGDGRALAEMILTLAEDEPRRTRMGVAARSTFEQSFTRQRATRRWSAMISEIALSAAHGPQRPLGRRGPGEIGSGKDATSH